MRTGTILVAALLSSCATQPESVLERLRQRTATIPRAVPATDDEVSRRDIGPAPTLHESVIAAFVPTLLKDPDSLMLRVAAPARGTYQVHQTKDPRFAWHVTAFVNAKNSFGGYTGFEPWDFYFLANDCVALRLPGRDLVEVGNGGRRREEAGLLPRTAGGAAQR